MDEVTSTLFTIASKAWPNGWVTRSAFAEYVKERAEGDGQLSDEAVAALYLACACLRGVGPALKAFESHYLPDIRRAGARAGLNPDEIGELAQMLREELLVGRNGAAPTLGEYRGRGELRGWLRVTATRAAIRMKKRAQKAADPEIDRLEARAADDDPELSYMKALYRKAFRSAFRNAALTLDPREKKILHQHTIEGLTIDQLGDAHGVHRATAARWVQAAREKLLSAVRKEFAKQVNVSPRELASVFRLVQSRLDVTMRRLLA
jgi:RNA polymerase sigma-70 factor (ECF subfamily)